jgi:Uma2 family endonuclease
MSTILVPPGADQSVCMPATWEIYEGLLRTRGDKSRPRYIFCDGRLTAVSPGEYHESWKSRLGSLIEILFDQLEVDSYALGSVTLRASRESRAGVEADETFYLTNIEKVAGKKDLIMGEDPPPDLVVEVVVSHPEQDALEVYRRFGVREVWVCKDGGLEFLVLGPDGRYEPSPTSALVPCVIADELAPWVYRVDPRGDRYIRREFRGWVDATLVPRYRPDADA